MAEERFQPIIIRYDGLDASKHEIELGQLGASLEGASKLIGMAAHFAVTGSYAKRAPALAVRVLTTDRVIRSGSVEIIALIATLAPLTPSLPFVKEMGSKAIEHVVNYVLAKFGGRKPDMDRIVDLLETALKENGQTSRVAIEAMRSTVETIAIGARPAARQFVAPVGNTCAVARLGAPENGAIDIDVATKDAIDAPQPVEVLPERPYRVLISELDVQKGTCKLSLEGEEADERYSAQITDPVARLPDNPYATAMTKQHWLTVHAKAQTKEGDVEKFYISDTAP